MKKLTKLVIPVVAAVGLLASSAALAQGGQPPRLGQPGFYGVVPPMKGWQPKLWNAAPIIAGAAIAGAAALYLNVPTQQRNNWSMYCGQYNACGRPVYFVQDNWYRQVYAPQYQRQAPPPPPQGVRPPQGGPMGGPQMGGPQMGGPGGPQGRPPVGQPPRAGGNPPPPPPRNMQGGPGYGNNPPPLR